MTSQSGSRKVLISVIVPAHNCAAYISSAIESLLSQTLKDIEIIVVDDGSTDDTSRIASEHAERDCRVRVIRRKLASGRPAVARNEGLRAAEGDYVAFLDADDISVPSRFASAIEAMRKTDATLVFADMCKFDDQSGTREPQTELQKGAFLSQAAPYLRETTGPVYVCAPNFIGFMLAYTPVINTQTVVFSRALLCEDPQWFDETLVCSEDIDLFYRLATRARTVFVDETQTFYRVRRDSITATNPERMAMDQITVGRINLDRFHSLLSPREIDLALRKIASGLFDLAYFRWCEGRRTEARATYLESWRIHKSFAAATGYGKAFLHRGSVIASAQLMRRALRMG